MGTLINSNSNLDQDWSRLEFWPVAQLPCQNESLQTFIPSVGGVSTQSFMTLEHHDWDKLLLTSTRRSI